jgi:hypothetical protein
MERMDDPQLENFKTYLGWKPVVVQPVKQGGSPE